MPVASGCLFNDPVIDIYYPRIHSMEQEQKFSIEIANTAHQDFAQIICDEMESSAKARERHCQKSPIIYP
jgi:hypothetical protein